MRKKTKRQKIKFIKKQIILLVLLFIFLLPFSVNFGRYAINSLNEFFNRSKEFYFYADKLGENYPRFLIDNWSGVDDYTITIYMNSRKNNILGASYDIPYNISCECTTNNAICTLSNTEGIIDANTNTDSFNVIVTPNTQFETGDEVRVTITAVADSVYTKTLTGEFILRVGKENITYTIDDSENNPYLELNITNTKSFYIVDEAFGSHVANDQITIDEYLSLSDENKEKCHASIVTLNFDPEVVQLDMTNSNYLNAVNVKTKTLNSFEYIYEITFKIEAISSATVRFYKTNVNKDYTYPNSSNSSIVSFSSK